MRAARRIRWIVRSRHRVETGTTLVELTVVVALIGIMLPAIYGTMSFVERQTSITSDRFTATSNGQIVMDRVSREIRAAQAPTTTTTVFLSASSMGVTFYASLGARSAASGNPLLGPTLIHICTAVGPALTCPASGTTCYTPTAATTWPGCSLLEISTPATNLAGAAPVYTGASRTQIDATGISGVGAVFAYYDATGAVIPAATLATTAGLATIEEVWITIATQASKNGPAVSLTMQVPLPNVDYG